VVIDAPVAALVCAVTAVLVVATLAGRRLERAARTDAARTTARNVRDRVAAWWWMVGLLVAAFSAGRGAVIVLFAAVSLLALRELYALVPFRSIDRNTLLIAMFVAVPVQYLALWTGWMGLFAVFVPVWTFLTLSARIAMSGEPDGFVGRVASAQYGLMIGVYCLSHAPALLMLQLPGFDGQDWKLLIWLLLVVQFGDVLQYLWGKGFGRIPIAPRVSPAKTLEGVVGGTASATLLGGSLWFLTPLPLVQAAGFALVVTLAGFCGGLVMSAIKRDAGVKDYGGLLSGHGGVMDRVDSLAFAAPVFFHLLRWWVPVV
jgi:phosphatidate cytidylyltransferase